MGQDRHTTTGLDTMHVHYTESTGIALVLGLEKTTRLHDTFTQAGGCPEA